MSFKQPDEWQEEMCLKMIREFRKRPILWNPQHLYYYKKAMKPDAWQEVADSIGMPARACKYKMNILMSSLRREKAKMKKLNNKAALDVTGNTRPYESRWFAYKAMSFLLNKKGETKLDFTVDEDSTDIDIENTNTNPNPNKRKISYDSSTQESDDFSIKQEIVELEEDNEHQHNLIIQSTSKTEASSAEDADEINSFANFIAAKMKKYNEQTKNVVQREICEIIFKADQKFYENV